MDGNLYHTIITFGEICYLTAHLTHFIYSYVASDMLKRTICTIHHTFPVCGMILVKDPLLLIRKNIP